VAASPPKRSAVYKTSALAPACELRNTRLASGKGRDMAIEWWIVLATLGGPVLAVQTQKFIERAVKTVGKN